MKRFKHTTVSALVAALAIGFPAQALAQEAPVELGTTEDFAVLAGTEITNVPTSDITGDVGLSPGTGAAITGLTCAEVTGTIYDVDGTYPDTCEVTDPALLTTAKNDLVTAYDDAAGRTPTETFAGGDNQLGGQTLTSGVYAFGAASTANLVGTLTLNGQNDPDAVWIFQASSTLVTASSSVVSLTNGAQACNVFWQVGSSATLGSDSVFVGTIMALTSIGLDTGATINGGQALARDGAVTLDQNVITDSACALSEPPDDDDGDDTDSGSDTGSLAAGDIVPKLPNAGAGPRN